MGIMRTMFVGGYCVERLRAWRIRDICGIYRKESWSKCLAPPMASGGYVIVSRRFNFFDGENHEDVC